MTGIGGINNYNDLLSTYQRLMREGESPASINKARESLRARAEDAVANLDKGKIALQTGNQGTAIDCFSTAIKNAGRIGDMRLWRGVMAEAYHNRSLAYKADGKPDLADQDMAAFNYLVKQEPNPGFHP